MEITILGGGHGCYAAVVEMFEKGHQITWWRRDAEAASRLAALGRLQVEDFNGERDIPVGAGGIQLCETLEQALAKAQLVVVPLPATTHETLALQLAPLWRDGQVVFLPPGTFGSYIFAKAARQAGNNANVAFAEAGTLPYLVRRHGEAKLVISAYAARLPTGIFPLQAQDWAWPVLSAAYPAVEKVGDALSGALMNAGPIIHPPLILMNAGPLEHFPAWDIHNEGTQPSIRRVTDALDVERVALREALGYTAPHFPLADHYANDGDEWMYGRAAHERLTGSEDWREHIILTSHRYMMEDTRLGLSFMVSAGRWAGCAMPVANGLLSIASAVTGQDLYSNGRSFETLGLMQLNRAELVALLDRGLT